MTTGAPEVRPSRSSRTTVSYTHLMQYIDADRVDLHYVLPLAEIIYDFFDTLKSRTRGYASFDYRCV